MKTSYIGNKIIKAQPMSHLQYKAYRNWLAKDGEEDRAGYLVEYEPDGNPNDHRHDGYISWTPKEPFDKAYVEVGEVDHLRPHVQRMVAEKAKLDDDLRKLRAFTATELFKSLPEGDRELMEQQSQHMQGHSMVLAVRIARAEAAV